MTRITESVLLALILSPLAVPLWAQGTYTAATCNQSDVNAVINGPTHQAVDGDTIKIPAGSCSWSSGVTAPSGIGITIQGSGTPNSTPATTGASSSCSSTAITAKGGTTFRMTPGLGNSTSRISCMLLQAAGSAVAMSILGSCTANGCPNLRVDNVTFSGWQGVTHPGNSYGITAVGDMFGVFDHNTIKGVAGNYLQLVEFSHASYLGVGSFGDNSWHQPESYGSANFLFIENNTFNSAGTSENEGTAGNLTNQGGGRIVARFNQYAVADSLNFSLGWHGTESSGRPRSTRAFEFYGNTYTCSPGSACGDVVASRGGTGLAWGNTINHSGGASLNNFYSMQTYRAFGSINWGVCDGSSVYDTNDGVTYFSGKIGSYSGGVVTVAATNPGWTTNQWSPTGAPYSMHDVTQSTGGEITANGSNTLTVNSGSGGPGSWTPSAGDSIEILRATACIDQAGGRGSGILYSGDPASPSSSAAQVSSPSYVWSNTINGGNPVFAYAAASTLRVIASRDYYVESINQAAQTSSTSPFNGTTKPGIGHGTIANRPTTCMPHVAYWATDQGSWNQSGSGGQGQLYVCTASNTWTLYYAPYTYPHPLTAGGSQGPAPPTNLAATPR